ncbi:MAG: GNAT family N-acetyltransferase [Azospira oryzae]|nr:MAG: GNAT family N-acetyltransferase [Azospira oryzae]PZP78893.1 MAG: GNAT family N-acetyltransferase [Azospira oryzae]
MPEYTVRLVSWDAAQASLAAVRRAVFIDEQRVPEALEWDGLDPRCVHALAEDAEGRPIGTARLLPDGHIGRMAVLQSWRRKGVGGALLCAMLSEARRRGLRVVHLHAQVHAVPFYERCGFAREGETFLEAGIPHVRMVRNL